ncbi:hypothetical protein E8Q24_09610 [Salmonella enterica]|nr:hypothetical protein [Salmonella enterica subsp. enterica serovar Dahomey]
MAAQTGICSPHTRLGDSSPVTVRNTASLASFAALQLCSFAALQLCSFAALQLCSFAALQLCSFAGVCTPIAHEFFKIFFPENQFSDVQQGSVCRYGDSINFTILTRRKSEIFAVIGIRCFFRTSPVYEGIWEGLAVITLCTVGSNCPKGSVLITAGP